MTDKEKIPDQTEWPELGDSQKMAHGFRMADWATDKKPVWDRVCEKYGGKKEAFEWGTWFFFDWSVGKAWPTLSSMTKARKFGWNRYDDTYETWVETFKAFENAGVLPLNRVLLAGAASSKAVNGEAKLKMPSNNGEVQAEAPPVVAA